MIRSLSIFVAISLASASASKAITVDGSLDAEYGAAKSTVSFNPSAPTSNFGAPTAESNLNSYSIYLTATATAIYGYLSVTSGSADLLFANLYFSTTGTGSNIGFEITNNYAFTPGGPANQPDNTSAGITSVTSAANKSIEFMIPWSVFVDDSLGLGITKIDAISNNTLQLRLSQSFGYSVAGGASYGNDRLGVVTYIASSASVPDSSGTAAILGLALAGLMVFSRFAKTSEA